MSDFLKRFLTGRAEPFVHLGAFGKHPGWDDHIEDIGLESDSLVQAKRLMYVAGIGGQIDTGAWEQLPALERLDEFNHVWLWSRGKEFIVGRMWSSVDGKGRTRYPMVLAVHTANIPLDRVLWVVLPKLQEVEKLCKEISSARAVREILQAARTELRAALITSPMPAAEPLSPAARQNFTEHAAWGADGAGLSRVLYDFKSKFSGFAREKFVTVTETKLRAQQARVPSLGMNAQPSLVMWEAMVRAVTGSNVPVLFFVPEQGAWVDVTVGEPASADFFCLRATPQHNPLSSDIPYKLEETFLAEAKSWKDAFARDVAPPAATKTSLPKPASATPLKTPGEKSSGNTAKIVVGLIVLLGMLLGGAFLMAKKSGTGDQPQVNPGNGKVPQTETNPVPEVAKPAAEQVTEVPPVKVEPVAKTNEAEVPSRPGGLMVAGTVPKAAQISVSLGGKPVGQPAMGALMSENLRPGNYEVTVSLANYDSWITNVAVKSGDTVRLPVIELFEARGRIAWSVNLAGAVVELLGVTSAGEKVGRKLSGMRGVEALDPGQYELVARYEGIEPATIPSFRLEKRGTNTANLKLDYWIGGFESDPSGVTVTAGSRKLGVTPVKELVLGGRDREIRFDPSALEGTNKFYATNLTVSVAAGRTNKVNVKLAKIPPWPLRYVNPAGMEFVWVEGMPGKSDGGAWMGKFEVTEDDWAKVMGTGGKAGSRFPMVRISVAQAKEFLAKLSAQDANRNYQLPGREQWDHLANISRNSPATERAILSPDAPGSTPATHPQIVGSTHATNRFGISDVFGNVAEMLADGKSAAGASYLDYVVPPENDQIAQFYERNAASGTLTVGIRVVLDSGNQSGAPR